MSPTSDRDDTAGQPTTIAELSRTMRKARGMTQQDVADFSARLYPNETPIDRTSIRRIEEIELIDFPKKRILRTLAAAYQVPDWVIINACAAQLGFDVADEQLPWWIPPEAAQFNTDDHVTIRALLQAVARGYEFPDE